MQREHREEQEALASKRRKDRDHARMLQEQKEVAEEEKRAYEALLQANMMNSPSALQPGNDRPRSTESGG